MNIPIIVNGRQPVGPREIPQNPFDLIEPDVTPEENQEDIEMVAKEFAEGYNTALQTLINEGLALFTKGPPMQRHDAYMRVPVMPRQPVIDPITGAVLDPGDPGQPTPGTFPEELMLVLTPDYGEMVRAGMLPMPQSPMWKMLFTLPPFVADYFLKDFREVHKQYEERIQKQVERP